MRATTIVIALMTYFSVALTAQNVEQNLDKYWQYRDKLTTQYMLVGDGQGYSLPASYINPGLERMKWSDNTIWLGWYIGTLATEYHLLHNEFYTGYDEGIEQRRQQNRMELYFAIKAAIRLDADAEVYFPAPCDSIPNQRNGFFLRDDVPIDFTDSFPGYNFVDSDYSEVNIYVNEMSQDQVYHVLLGLSLVKRFVPDTVVVNGFNLHDEAVDQALLIGAWVHQDGWIIKNPVCGNKDVDRGPDATLLAKGLNLALGYISDGTVDYSADVNGTSDFVWESLTNPALFVNVDNLHMTMALSAMGNGWGANTLDDLMVLADSNKWYAYPLLNIALRDTQSVSNYQTHKELMHFWTDSMLNEAPIGGPLTTYPDSNDHGYGVNNRFIRPRWKHYVTTNPNEAGHQWNGLDYMLLHNLQLIVKPQKWADSIVSVGSVPLLQNLTLYPNPTKNEVYVKGMSGSTQVNIIDPSGRHVLSAELYPGNEKISLAGLSASIYWCHFVMASGQRQVKRMLVLP